MRCHSLTRLPHKRSNALGIIDIVVYIDDPLRMSLHSNLGISDILRGCITQHLPENQNES